MVSFRAFPAALVLAWLFALCPPARTQSAADSTTPPNARPVPERTVPTPFPPGPAPLEFARSIQLRSADAMSEQDRLLEADSESSIAERAGYADIAFNEGKWSYRQLVCPALPNHLFLRFTRNNGAGDVSVFSASIPRNGEGRIRIIPIERRSYSLFSPAPVNALTIAAFNRIRAEDQSGQPGQPGHTPGWLGTALCYAALAGANPMAAPQDAAGAKSFPSASAPSLEIPAQGGAIVRFTDFSSLPRPMEWTLIFSGKGRLLKATHRLAGIKGEKAIPPSTAEQNAKPIPSS
ncbi:MAG TPA: hypothetical protein VMD55_08480 [Terracidiphilus sp.]|nr:hypothetical protein [Terracidiphilus sp.]